MNRVFTDTVLNTNTFTRVFSSTTKEEDLVWHRDLQDRTVYLLNRSTDWKFQFDNELPILFPNKLFIPKGVYHRVIKGSGELKIKVVCNETKNNTSRTR